MNNKQTQKGGDNSTNLQANNMTLVLGIDEKRAREIYKEMSLQQRKEYSQEALVVAKMRVDEFENRLIPKMEKVDGALKAFADPSFQLLLVEAQKTAAATERVLDYDLLSELLIHRFQKGEDRKVRAGISRAVEIVDEISDDALLGLTVFHSVSSFRPISGDINEGLNVLNELFGKLFYDELPHGEEWFDHLYILDTIRFNTFSRLKPLQEYYSETLSGYVDIGISKGSENHKKAIDVLKEIEFSEDVLNEHALNSNYLRLPVTNQDSIKFLTKNDGNLRMGMPLSDKEVSALNSLYDLYEIDDEKKQSNVKSFMVEWDKRENLKKLREWWDNIAISFQITSVGKVLAHSNAERCEQNLPPLEV